MLKSLLLNLEDFTRAFLAELFTFAGETLVVEHFISGFGFQASVGLNIVLVQFSQLENKQLWLTQYKIDNITNYQEKIIISVKFEHSILNIYLAGI